MFVQKLDQQLKDSEEHDANYADSQLDKAEHLLLTKEKMRMEKCSTKRKLKTSMSR